MKTRDEDEVKSQDSSGYSRRDFLKISGITVAVPMVVGPTVVKAAGEDVPVYGPGPTPITLTINGQAQKLTVEPRETLLDALRNHLDLTGAKRVCDRGECGACTVLMDGKPIYACAVLAIDAQGHKVETVESLGAPERLHPIQQAFIDNDAQQCGFCTPGFIVASKALLDKHPNPTPAQLHHELAGNFCRCGTYGGIRAALGKGVRRG